VALAGGAGWVVLNLVAGRVHPLGSAALSLGILQAVRGAGTGLGPIAVSALPQRSRAAALAPHLSVGLALAGIVLFPIVESVPVVLLVVALLWGMGSGANWVLASAELQRLAPDRYVGRLASLDDLATEGLLVGGAFVGAAALEGGAGTTAAAIAGALLGLAGWVWLWLARGSRAAQADDDPWVSSTVSPR
jgi:predicted MFS family arabinose efflux permease